MAEFSKQWCEMNPELGFEPDFDIVEIFNNLDEGYYEPIICEGLGILGIAKENGKLLIARRNQITEEVTWELGDFLLF
jgi:hypothetical protein